MNRLGPLFTTFAMLSLVSIGGANATLPEIHRQVVALRGWMDDGTFAHLFALSQIAPGPNILIVSLVGWHIAGLAGLLIATVAILLPSSVLAFAVGRAMVRWETSVAMRVIKAGLVPIAVGLIAASGLVTARSSNHTPVAWAITAVAAVLFSVTRLNPLWLMAAAQRSASQERWSVAKTFAEGAATVEVRLQKNVCE